MPWNSEPAAIIAENLTLRYDGATIFENLNFTLEAGKITVLLGPSGVGKTSLLRIIAGLEPPDSGHVHPSGQVAYMAQNDLLLPWASIIDNVTIGATLRNEPRDTARAEKLLAAVGLADRAHHLPETLSGGMRQRAALARTLYENRSTVLMDEPFSALDAITRARIQNLAATLLTGKTVLLITHDPQEACRLAHHLLILDGAPATLTAIPLPGAPPRAVDDPETLAMQATLLRQLACE